MFDLDACSFVVRAEGIFRKRFKDFGQAGKKLQTAAEFVESLVADLIHAEVIEQAFHVGQFAVPFLFLDERVAAFPELSGVDAEFRKQHIVLHVARAQRLVVVVDQCDGVLRGGHGDVILAAASVDDKGEIRFWRLVWR